MTSDTQPEKYTHKFDNGQIKEEGNLLNGVEHGSYTAYFYETESRRKEGRYNSGKRVGEWKKYYPGGQLKEIRVFSNDKLDGDYILYFENGQIHEHGRYTVGEKDGEWLIYYFNGQLHEKRFYKNGSKDGKWMYFTNE